MAAYGSWSQPVFPQLNHGAPSEYFPVFPPPPAPLPTVPQQICASLSKPFSRPHKKHGPGSAKRIVSIESVDIPVAAPWPTGAAWFLSTLSALMFIIALIFHGVMFYYALDTPYWVVMCWPLILVPPVICNSIYLAHMARKEPAAPNINMVYLYVVLTLAYMAWAVYVTSVTYNEGKCQEGSYYSFAVAILALATVACALEWWLAVCKIVQRTAATLNVTVAIYEKCERKRKLVVTLKKDGNVIKEISFNMEKTTQDYIMNYTDGHCMAAGAALLLYKNPARCGNEKRKFCSMKYTGPCSADQAQFNNNTCYYENENLKQDCSLKYSRPCSAFASPFYNGAEEYGIEKIKEDCIEECDEDDSSSNNNKNNGGQSNNIA